MTCTICPRTCAVDRNTQPGFCACTDTPRTARIALHHYEEPPISGTRGSGTVFFTGCNLKCTFCQNHALRDGRLGKEQTAASLARHYLALQAQGAHNINLVTPTPHIPTIVASLERARSQGLTIPVVYNTNAYESVASLKRLEGLVDIYLPDFKYVTEELALRFSSAPHYAELAMHAISEMARQVGKLELNEAGLATRGLLVRHLVLPECVFDTRLVLNALLAQFGSDLHLSLMSQYCPTPNCTKRPLNRKLTQAEYDRALSYALSLGFTNIFMQELSSADGAYTPPFFEDSAPQS